jgi:hypothetical protein
MKYLLFVILFIVVGCTPVATYPPVENDMALAFSDSTNEPIPTILAESLRYAHEHFGGVDGIVFYLPDSMSSETYAIVRERVEGATPLHSTEQTAYYVTALRKRPFHAEVDVVFPSTTGQCEQATIYLSSSLIEPWRVLRDRVWLVPINELPLPNYTLIGVETISNE